MASASQAGTSGVHIWIKGDLLIRGLIPVPPPHELFSPRNMKKLLGYVIKWNKGGRSLPYAMWMHIAMDKMKLSKDYAWILFSVFWDFVNDNGEEEMQTPLEESSAAATTVPLAEFVLFLFLQESGRSEDGMRTPTATGDVLPTYLRTTVSSLPKSPYSEDLETAKSPAAAKLESAGTETKFLNFFRNKIGKIVDILGMPEHDEDYHEAAEKSTEWISAKSLAPLNLIFEGQSRAQKSGVNNTEELTTGMRFTDLLNNFLTQNIPKDAAKRLEVKSLREAIRCSLVPDPYYLVSCVPLSHHQHRMNSRQFSPRLSMDGGKSSMGDPLPYLGLTADGPVRITLVWDVCNRAVIKDSESMNGSYLKVANCKTAQLYFTPWFRSAVIENCKNTTIFIGPIKSTIRVQNCSGCTIVSICQRLLITECNECTFHIKCESSPLILGPGNLDVILAPYNAWYLGLECLVEEIGLNLDEDKWNIPIEISTSDAENLPSISPVDCPTSSNPSWSLMKPENFHYFAIPFDFVESGKEEKKQVLGELPPEYQKAIEKKEKILKSVNQRIQGLTPEARAKFQKDMEKAFEDHLKMTGQDKCLRQLEKASKSKTKRT